MRLLAESANLLPLETRHMHRKLDRFEYKTFVSIHLCDDIQLGIVIVDEVGRVEDARRGQFGSIVPCRAGASCA